VGNAAVFSWLFVDSRTVNQLHSLKFLTYVSGDARNNSITLPTPDEFAASITCHVG
jgi:hypothetical protein